MTIIPWRKSVPLAVADEVNRAEVQRLISVSDAYRSLDYRRGFMDGRLEGRTEAFAIGFLTGGALVGIAAWLVTVLT